MKKIICLFLAIFMLVGACAALTACGGGGDDGTHTCVDNTHDGKCDDCGKPVEGGTTCTSHKDENGDGKCDNEGCGETIQVKVEYPWDDASIVFQMTHNSSGQSLPSGCERYMAGEDLTAVTYLDTMVDQRNADAYINTKVSVTYKYYGDVSGHGWGENITPIYETIYYNAPGAPDLYCNFVYDMVGVSLKGMFANLLSTKYKYSGTGEYLNYFEFDDEDYLADLEADRTDDRGFMPEYMWSTTLSKNKVYMLSSDYFIDMVRAFFVIPVNVALLESGTMIKDITGDLDEDQDYTLNDFYAQVLDNKWTYDVMSAYCAAVYQPYSQNQSGIDLRDTLGFACGDSGKSATGFVYTTNITIIHKEYDAASDDYKYWFPTESQGLNDLAAALSRLFTTTGVTLVTKTHTPNYKDYGDNANIAIRTRFCDNKILFGDLILLGALEYDAYQELKKSSGFGVVPVPLYHDVAEGSDESYLTTLHNVGRVGAIAYNTDVFAQCTAFLNYQSTHSTDILDEYYESRLQYDVAGGNNNKGTVKVLQFIRKNVRSAFDKTMEDAIGVQNKTSSERWHSILVNNDYLLTDFTKHYSSLYQKKQEELESLVQQFYTLPS